MPEIPSYRTYRAKPISKRRWTPPATIFWSGHAASPRQWPDTWRRGKRRGSPDLDFRRAILAIGSRDPITLAQVDRLRVMQPDIAYIEAPGWRGRGTDRDHRSARHVVMIHATPGTGASVPDHVAWRLAAALDGAGPLENTRLVVSGGATAQIVLDYLGVGVLDLLGEAPPGLPIARAKGFTLITKSGGFGEPNALVEILAERTQAAAEGVS